MGQSRSLCFRGGAFLALISLNHAIGGKVVPLSQGVCEKVVAIESAGETRTYIAHVPSKFCISSTAEDGHALFLEPLPVIFAIHGFGAPFGMFTPIFGPFVQLLHFALIQPIGTGRPSSFNGGG